MQYADLEEILINSVKEVQIKLGYEKETIRFYYPEKALVKILKLADESADEWKLAMEGLKNHVKDRLGAIKITRSQGRFCFEIPPEGVEYVYKHVKSNGFLEAFIGQMEKSNVALEDILDVFHKFSDGKVICEPSEDEECDYVIYFEDSSVDYYRYYIKFHGNHATYHRFLYEEAIAMGL